MTPPRLHTYTVVPSLPEPLHALREMAYNLRWAWDCPTRQIFRDLDEGLWRSSGHNPAKMLGLIAQERLTQLASDAAFLRRLEAAYASFRAYLDGETWWSKNHAASLPATDAKTPYGEFKIGYFSAEFGITECLPIYSGGLGILAGDHLKSASDLGLPLVGVGFLYQRGYFRQSLNADGWQQENYPQTDFYSLPIEPVHGDDGQPLTVGVDFPGRVVTVQIWKAQVGRIPLYLMDTNLPQNNEADRHIAGNLYGGDSDTRIQQEIVLGIGGLQALQAMGITPTVCHMNEGHSAFLSLERIRRLIAEKGLSFADALEASAAGNLFTTHTPVPAGFDLFPPDLVRHYFGGFAGKVNLSIDDLLNRGRASSGGDEKFNMAVLAFRHARYINGVSELHGKVSRQMVQPSVPGFPLDEVPVGYVTNGIHTASFLSADMTRLLERTLGEMTAENLADPAYWAKVDQIPDATLWTVREHRRARMVLWARDYVVGRLTRRGAGEREVSQAREILEPSTLTIGFARRFATYKRGDLLLHDVERLKRILNNADRPVQFVFAGKAHPKDDAGKELIRRIVHFTRDDEVRRRIVFLEDYDMAMARYLVEGVDVWLNNPRRPMEASGTSGMKVIANGGLNFSVLDGWWAEGYDPTVGWEIGRGEDYDDHGYQDYVESQDIYETLEREIIPLFYDRGPEGLNDGLPHAWIAKIKSSMKALAPVYTTARMVREYAEKYYVPAAHRARQLSEDDFSKARALVVWKQKLRDHWREVGVVAVTSETDKLAAGQGATVHATIRLGTSIAPQDVAVELYTGPVDADRNLVETHTLPLGYVKPADGGEVGVYLYSGLLPTDRSGQQGFTVRIVPSNPDAVLPQELPLITWES